MIVQNFLKFTAGIIGGNFIHKRILYYLFNTCFLKRAGIIIFILSNCYAQSQCLTTFDKLLPDRNVLVDQYFGKALSAHNEYLAVGIDSHDSLDIDAGIVYMYQQTTEGYKKIATILPSEQKSGLSFGQKIYLNEHNLIVRSSSGIHIFDKPADGWKDLNSETALHEVSSLSYKSDILMSDDGNRLYFTNIKIDSIASIVISKEGNSWNNPVSTNHIKIPPEYIEGNVKIYDSKSMAINDGYMAVSNRSASYKGNNAVLYVFKDHSGDGISYEPIAILTGDQYTFQFRNMALAIDDDNIYTSMFENGEPFFHVFPKGTEWHDNNNYYKIKFTPEGEVNHAKSIELLNDEIIVSTESLDSTENIFIFHKDSLSKPDYYPERHIITKRIKNTGFAIATDVVGNQLIIGNSVDSDFNYRQGTIKVYERQPNSISITDSLHEEWYSANDNAFGIEIHQNRDYLLVGSPRDTETGNAVGAVYFYKEANDRWEKKYKIIPEGERSRYDNSFGMKVVHDQNDNLYIGAPGFHPSGKVYIYKYTSSAGLDLQLKNTIQPHDSLGRIVLFGSSIAVEGNLLAITAQDRNNGSANAVFIYEKYNNEWIFSDYLTFPGISPFSKSGTLGIDIFNGEILIGGFTSLSVAIYAKDKNDGKYKEKALLTNPRNEYNTGFGNHVRITQEHIFVGAPRKNLNGKYHVGAIYVYTKPKFGWKDTSLAQEILPFDALEYGYFGFSFETAKNTLVAGAPRNSNNLPGAAYVIQGIDYEWKETVNFLKFQGESLSETDSYGYSLSLNNDYFFIGAIKEDTEQGFNSGAIYATKMPPQVQLQKPVCRNSGVIDFFGYPYNGTWTGAGIIDSNKGLFDPDIAGEGIHLITYETPNCAYEGKLKIKVHPPLEIQESSDLNPIVCDGNEVILSIDSPGDFYYEWFYSENNNSTFYSIERGSATNSASLKTTKRGYYYCQVSNKKCPRNSETFTVSEKSFDIALDPVEVICHNEPVQLAAIPSGGIWKGEGVENGGLFNSENVQNGEYDIKYIYTDDHLCYDTASITITKTRIDNIQLQRNGDLCVEGFADIFLDKVNNVDKLNSKWFFLENGQSTAVSFDEDILESRVYAQGVYFVTLSNDYCTINSDSIVISDIIKYTFDSLDNFYKICGSESLSFEIKGNDKVAVEWLFSREGVQYDIINEEHTLDVKLDGYYKANIFQGLCGTQTPPQRVKFYAKDSIQIPNVITVNNDGKNEEFRPYLPDLTNYKLFIYNRYGKEVFHSEDEQDTWRGENEPAGVYYWFMQLSTLCENHTMKGFIHLLK